MVPPVNGNYPYYYGAPAPAPVPPQKKQPLFQQLLRSDEYACFRGIFRISFITGLAFVAYVAFGNIYSYVLLSVPGLAEKYLGDATFGYLCDAVYSFLCVGLPFVFVLLLLDSGGIYTAGLPFGRARAPKKAFLIIVAGLGVCFVGNILTGWFTSFLQSFGLDFYSYQTAVEGEPMPQSVLEFTVFALRTAVVPALVEEFAFRGVVLQPLRKYGDWFAIAVSAVMFGLMHGNIMQVPFALVAGFALGYACVVTGSIWTSVIIHFLNNFISVVYTLIIGGIGESAGFLFSTAATYGCILLGLIAFLAYRSGNRSCMRLYPCEEKEHKKRGLAFFLAPTTLIAILMLARFIGEDIIL